jgi:hypothetical protein
MKIDKNLLIGKSPNSREMIEYKASLTTLRTNQWEAAIGLILGDAGLQTQNQGKSYRLKFEWSDKSKVYLDHVYNLFDEWVLSPPHKKTRVSPKGNTVINWGFQTISHEAFNPLAELFLCNNKKIISDSLIINHLTPRGLAYFALFCIIEFLFIYLSLTSITFTEEILLDDLLANIIPIVTYLNADTLKDQIVKDNYKKSGVYRWTNLLSNKTYVGRSVNLGYRFRDYYKYSFLTHEKNKNMVIYKALLKYGYSNFKLEILEYCDTKILVEREQYHLTLLNPEYNILNLSSSSLGFKHTPESLSKIREHLSKINAEKSIKVKVTDTHKETITLYDSIRKAAKALNCDKSTILYQETRKSKSKLFRKRYLIEILRD